MKLPNANQAVVDIRKLRDYCLNPASPRGQTKARVFASALGLRRSDAEELRTQLLRAATERECEPGETDAFGQRYTLDFVVATRSGRAWVRSGWIVRTGEDFPRLTTCYVIVRSRIS
ncbi:MAG: hypothetical protein FJ399_09935 [Verrucomicrobia bacterium]|nr:hypothetical protein [Verrucomicrobiota bacterium]